MTYIKTKLKRSIDIDAIITLHYFEYMKNFEFKGESHNFWEFLYVDKGTIAVRADDTWTTSMISQIITEARQTFSTPMHIPSVEQVELKDNTPFASQQMILLYLELFLITLIREHQPTGNASSAMHKSSPEKESTKHERLSEILKFLEFHICEKLTVSDICDAFSISRSALQSLFHEQLDCGVIDHFNKMKIQRAKDIICDGSMNLTEIAYFLSYSSLPYFSKQFRIATGMSPSAYASSVKGITDALRNSKERERDA